MVCYPRYDMKSWVAALGLTGIGFYIAGSIIVGIVAGRWLDEKMNSEPVWLIVGLILGIAAAVYGVYMMIKPFIGSNGRKGNS